MSKKNTAKGLMTGKTETGAALAQDLKSSPGKKISFFQLIFLTTAFFASVRRIPNIAYAGWESVLFMGFAILMFVLPVSFVSAELATAMPADGGLAVWISRTISPKWGFVASFLVWIQMCFGMVTVGAAFADMLATVAGRSDLLGNDVYIGVVVIVLFWLITLLIIAGVPITAVSTWGMVFGLIVPLVILLAAGPLYLAAHPPSSSLLPNFGDILPNFTHLRSLANLSGVIFLFAGMEQASNYANRITNPRKTYPKALITATLLTAVLFSTAGMLVYFIVPRGTIKLADPAQVFTLIFKAFGVPWMTTVIAVLIGLSCITELAAWISGPSRNLLESARQGILPSLFAKTNRHDIPVPLVIVQAVLVSAIALVFVFIPGTNAVFDVILTMAVAIYAIVYILILAAGIRFRKGRAGASAAFQIPGGKTGAWLFTILGFIGLAIVFGASLVPPDTLAAAMRKPYPVVIIAGVAVFVAIPLAIYRLRQSRTKASHKDKNS